MMAQKIKAITNTILGTKKVYDSPYTFQYILLMASLVGNSIEASFSFRKA